VLEVSALLQLLKIDKPIKRLEANEEIFVIVVACFGDFQHIRKVTKF
jgi:hypothetical protein